MKFFLPLFTVLSVCLLSCRAEEAGAQKSSSSSAAAAAAAAGLEVQVGGRSIKLPPPPGFERVDGKDPAKDKIVAAALPATNRYLARFEPVGQGDAKDASGAEHTFNAQILRALESKEIGLTAFSQVKQGMKTQLDELSKNIEAEMAKQTGKIGAQVKEAAGIDAALSIGNMAVLGYFEDSPQSLGFSMVMNTEVKLAGQTLKSRDLGASLIVPVNGRLLYLYANTTYKSDADKQWAEKAVLAWRDAVVGANPKVEGPPAGESSSFRLGQAAGFGLVGGLVGGLTMWLFRKFRRKA